MSTSSFQSISVKNKWYLLLAVISLFFILSYSFNIKKTIVLICSYNSIEEQLKATSATAQTSLNKLGIQPISDIPLIEYISMYCDGNEIEIRGIVQSSYKNEDGFMIETNKIVLSGYYAKILKLLYNIEVQHTAIINSVKWNLYRNQSDNKYQLLCSIYVKYLKNE